MGSDFFHFKQFSIDQALCGMRLSTDSVLLGAWFSIPTIELTNGIARPLKVLDVGTGTGILALMLAQRAAYLNIEAIDKDENAILAARKNISNSPYNDRIKVVGGDYSRLYPTFSKESYSLIISNPPYFKPSLPTRNAAREAARYATELSTEVLFKSSHYLLNDTGKLVLITPAEQLNQMLIESTSHEMKASRITYVVTKEGKQPKRVLTEWVKSKYSLPTEHHLHTTTETLNILDALGNYSLSYKTLVQDFYLDSYFQK